MQLLSQNTHTQLNIKNHNSHLSLVTSCDSDSGSQWFKPHLLFNLSLPFTKIPLDTLEQAMASVLFFWDLSHKLDNKQNLHNVYYRTLH